MSVTYKDIEFVKDETREGELYLRINDKTKKKGPTLAIVRVLPDTDRVDFLEITTGKFSRNFKNNAISMFKNILNGFEGEVDSKSLNN